MARKSRATVLSSLFHVLNYKFMHYTDPVKFSDGGFVSFLKMCTSDWGHVFLVSFYTLSDGFTFNLFPQLTCSMKKYLEESSISTLGSLKDFIVAYSITILLH